MVANVFRVVAGALLISVAASAAAAQRGQQSGLGGTVTDATGAVLAGVQLTISSPQLIGGPQTTKSDATGLYRFPALLPGAYALTAMHPGFERLERSGIELPVGIAVTLDVRLHLTPVETRVDVEGVVPAIDVQSSSSPATIERALLENLPTPLSRLIVDVAELVPGLTRGVAFGGPALVMPVSVDGTSNNDPNIGFPAMNPSINWLDSMQVVSVGAPAEYGENTNARINLVTRSGSNRLSGLGEDLVDAQPLDDVGRRALRVVEHRRAGGRANPAGSGLVLHRRRLLTEHLPAFWIPSPRSPGAWRAGYRRPPAEAAAQAVRGARAGDAARRVRRAA